MSKSYGVNYLFDVLFHEVMENAYEVQANLNNKLARLYDHCNAPQREALDDAFNDLFHVSFSRCFNTQVNPQKLI
jgi:hypothetical protein